MKNLRAVLLIAVVIAVSAGIGGRFGRRIGTNGNLIDTAPLETHVGQVERMTRLISGRFMDDVDWDDALYSGAIPGMLSTLDPHSTFFSPEAFAKMREEQRGSYAGVGMQILNFRNKTIVDFPFPHTPAFKGGVLPGDAIEMVDEEPANGLDVEQVADRVKGTPGTSVHLSLSREGREGWVELDLVRDSIPRPTIPIQTALPGNIGYLRVSSFGDTTSRELDRALRNLEKSGLEGLILDLRDNRGGLLTAGVHMAGKFLEEGAGVVSHRGRASRERKYDSRVGSDGARYPLVAVVNCNSASASEIVAGALQDHDRALIAGTNTFGKGLVQSVFALPESTGMVLTTARYYTPSGRLIQRPYQNVSLSDYYNNPCSDHYSPQEGEPRLTDSGRKVYERGGITPDVEILEPGMTEFQVYLRRSRGVERFVAALRAEGYEPRRGADPPDSLVARLRSFLVSEDTPFGDEVFGREQDFLFRSLKTHLHISFFDYYEGLRVLAELDPVVLQAMDLIPEAQRLLDGEMNTLTKKVVPAETAQERTARTITQ